MKNIWSATNQSSISDLTSDALYGPGTSLRRIQKQYNGVGGEWGGGVFRAVSWPQMFHSKNNDSTKAFVNPPVITTVPPCGPHASGLDNTNLLMFLSWSENSGHGVPPQIPVPGVVHSGSVLWAQRQSPAVMQEDEYPACISFPSVSHKESN